jgi:DUF4097 and DUF4098 domain-containing protein YvlB
MTKTLRIPAVAVLALLSVTVPATARAEQKETERVDRTVQIRAGGQLRLKNFSGKVTITGSNRADMVVHAVRRATRDRLDHIKLDIQETGSGVTIEANRKDEDWHEKNDNVVDTQFDIEVPADISVDVEVFSSDVAVHDVRGKQRIHTFSGNVDLSGGEKDVNAETFSGDISVKVVQGISASVDFDSFSGSLNTDVPMNYRSSGKRRIKADLGGGGGADYSFKTFSGDVRIR